MNPYAASQDTSSWGTSVGSPSSKQVTSPSLSSWGTVQSKSPSGTATPTSFGHPGSLLNHAREFSPGKLANIIPRVVYRFFCVVDNVALPHLGRPTQGVIGLNPALQDGRLCFNFANPPPPPSPSESRIYGICHSSAFNPSMSYAQINFEGFPHWVLRMELPQALTVFTILQHVYQFLQEPDMQGTQFARPGGHNHHQLSYSRDAKSPSAHPYVGKKRILCLGPRTLFAGLTPAPGANSWTIHLIPISH
ncbi:hypothetical protein CPB84DRAFT_1752842 [Gymnopilus junonius]|uniref:DUF6699 domain-containing protein n=1 Tax=Gymnopilus junonius TaxID=109634 RepID=A0A9P5TGI5_GYMJU|nr:hypothetical protein CPB84DRAFT_1752842 [Gymnopilus junonius]